MSTGISQLIPQAKNRDDLARIHGQGLSEFVVDYFKRTLGRHEAVLDVMKTADPFKVKIVMLDFDCYEAEMNYVWGSTGFVVKDPRGNVFGNSYFGIPAVLEKWDEKHLSYIERALKIVSSYDTTAAFSDDNRKYSAAENQLAKIRNLRPLLNIEDRALLDDALSSRGIIL
jgi:hypothetical protein